MKKNHNLSLLASLLKKRGYEIEEEKEEKGSQGFVAIHKGEDNTLPIIFLAFEVKTSQEVSEEKKSADTSLLVLSTPSMVPLDGDEGTFLSPMLALMNGEIPVGTFALENETTLTYSYRIPVFHHEPISEAHLCFAIDMIEQIHDEFFPELYEVLVDIRNDLNSCEEEVSEEVDIIPCCSEEKTAHAKKKKCHCHKDHSHEKK